LKTLTALAAVATIVMMVVVMVQLGNPPFASVPEPVPLERVCHAKGAPEPLCGGASGISPLSCAETEKYTNVSEAFYDPVAETILRTSFTIEAILFSLMMMGLIGQAIGLVSVAQAKKERQLENEKLQKKGYPESPPPVEEPSVVKMSQQFDSFVLGLDIFTMPIILLLSLITIGFAIAGVPSDTYYLTHALEHADGEPVDFGSCESDGKVTLWTVLTPAGNGTNGTTPFSFVFTLRDDDSEASKAYREEWEGNLFEVVHPGLLITVASIILIILDFYIRFWQGESDRNAYINRMSEELQRMEAARSEGAQKLAEADGIRSERAQRKAYESQAKRGKKKGKNNGSYGDIEMQGAYGSDVYMPGQANAHMSVTGYAQGSPHGSMTPQQAQAYGSPHGSMTPQQAQAYGSPHGSMTPQQAQAYGSPHGSMTPQQAQAYGSPHASMTPQQAQAYGSPHGSMTPQQAQAYTQAAPHASAAAATPLPAGWTSAVDANGAVYFTNPQIAVSTYDDPRTTPLPPGWLSAVDPNSGRTYFQNHATQVTTFDDPRFTVAQ
jgi:WW domain